jgi:phosphoenolpyruvate carboxylase
VTVQSSFRYDYSRKQVETAVKQLHRALPKSKPKPIGTGDRLILEKVINESAGIYQSTLRQLIPDMKSVFAAVPRRRERRLHIGLLAYQRSVGDQSLPRAITFTCGFYSMGVPPEFIGLGRSLAKLSAPELKLLLKKYPSLVDDIEQAGRFLSKDNLRHLAKRNRAWRRVQEDVDLTESVLGLRLGPKTYSEKAHNNLSANVLITSNQKSLTALIEELARLRKSLG